MVTLAVEVLQGRPVRADETVEAPSSSDAAPKRPTRSPQRLEDVDFYFDAPLNYRFIDTQAPAPGGRGSISAMHAVA